MSNLLASFSRTVLIGTVNNLQGNRADVVITSDIGPGLAEIGMTVFR